MTRTQHLRPGESRHADPYEQRAEFLRRIWPLLGPVQREHLTSHCQAVAALVGQLGRLVRLTAGEQASVELAALLHDIGKAAVPEALLAKPATLTASERRALDQHVGIGAGMARALGADARAVAYIRCHHLPFDALPGRADAPYVRGARVLCVADALASMLSHRAYSPALSVRGALGELRRCAGSQFDPLVVECAQGLTGLSSAA